MENVKSTVSFNSIKFINNNSSGSINPICFRDLEATRYFNAFNALEGKMLM